jgi:hypothetical protein
MINLIFIFYQFRVIWDIYYRRRAKWTITSCVKAYKLRNNWRRNIKSIDDMPVRYLRYSFNFINLPVYDNRRKEAHEIVVPFMMEWFDKKRM